MKDQISALMDDELDVESSEHLIEGMKKGSEFYECWSTYHLIGDAMRGHPEFTPGFHQRLMERIDTEPTVLAPKRKLTFKRSYLMSVAASVAAVMFVGWMVLQQQAQSPSQDLPAASIAQGNVSPESMNAYLLAHQELSPDSGMQASQYVRPVTYSESGN
ncbi:MAG TPA: sigma-E factor negative regulatory protein [Methylophilaceae bacterium]|jgi:sigma-E factor negative regulatory protein RseA|nr:sigma-E factor negative regulatory protein [Methylophilaceae bacterium]